MERKSARNIDVWKKRKIRHPPVTDIKTLALTPNCLHLPAALVLLPSFLASISLGFSRSLVESSTAAMSKPTLI